MRNRAFRPIAATLSILLLTGVPAQAGPVVVSDIVQILGSYQNPPDLKLRSVSQNSMALSADVRGNMVQSATARQSASNDSLDIPDTALGAPITDTSDSILGGISLANVDQQVGVDIIDLGDVDGTVCDCGEIAVKGGGFPKWPLLFLAAIPFFFIHGCDDCETPNSTPTPTPTPTPPGVPEPASLLLFGSGLAAFGAGLRRRYAKAKLAAQIQATEEG
jgi:hypothetical protein